MFINDSISHSEYQGQESLIHNSGLHALQMSSYANLAFLTVKSHFCELLTEVQTIQQDDDAIVLGMRLMDQLAHLDHEKELQWVQQ